MMIALIGLNANAAIYLVGNEPLGQGWDPSKGIEMTENNDGTYTYDVVINGEAWFCFAEALTPGNSNADWDVFNGQYRYGPTGGSNQTVDAGAWITTQKQGNGTGSYYFRGTGDKYTVTFDKTNMKFKIDGYVEPVVYESFTVAGNNADIFGETWNVTLTQNDMTLDETDGWYKLVKENVEITGAPYTLYYKVAANHAWGESWGNPDGPDGNQDYVFNENGTYNLTFKFNFDTKEVTLDAVQVEVGPVVETYYIVAGTENLFGSNWAATDTLNLMTEGENGMFTWTKEGFEATAGTEVEFKVVANGNWNTCWPPSDEEGDHNWNYQFAEDGVYTVVITFNEESKEINLNATRTGDLPEPPQPTVDPVYIMGNVTEYNWDAIHGVEMTYDETNKVYTAEINVTDANNGLGYFGFTKKLADPESETDVWEQIAPYRFGPMCDDEAQNWVMTEVLLNQSCELDMEGSKSIEIPAGAWTVTVDLNNGLFKINGEWPTDTIEPEIPNVYLFGDVNDYAWDPTQGHMMDYAEGIYTGVVTATLREGQQVAYIGFTKQLANPDSDVDPWEQIAPYRFGPMGEGENWQMTEELLGVECALATDGSYLSIAIPAGEWTFSIDLVNNTFTINGEWPETPGPEPYEGDVYILGEVNDNGGWFPNIGVKMTRDAENNVYTATITTAGENEGYSYFSFSKKLAENDWENGGWDEINNGTDRFGAVTDGNPFLVTEEQLGNELALAYAADPAAFQIEAGQWKLTLSVDNKTLVIEKVTALRGDVNSDDAVTIGDVTDLIDYLLGGSPANFNEDAANCNLDELGVSIADVTALIDFLLSGQW